MPAPFTIAGQPVLMAQPHLLHGVLGRCHGYVVRAEGVPIGSVETPVFPEARIDPDYIVVRTSDAIPGTFRVVPATLIDAVDRAARTITLAATCRAVAGLPERLPLEQRRGVPNEWGSEPQRVETTSRMPGPFERTLRRIRRRSPS